MMKNFKKTAVLLTASAIVFSMGTSSFAYYGPPPCYNGPCWGPPPPPDDGGVAVATGFLVGLEAALLTTISAGANQYDADTLQVQAAAFEDTRVKGAVFEAFAHQVATQMGSKASQVDEATFDELVAQRILKGL